MAIQMKATEQNVPVVLFIMSYKVVLTFEFKRKIFARFRWVVNLCLLCSEETILKAMHTLVAVWWLH